ncbi:hypothetical protein UFOVP410_126 [uncultured Caudovirales phage]|uniref:Uncharacterized protein n=1 Tax=uncultured Caudovirales phage TaxID=2100421 RepID=A0A6J5M6Z0_9CAUD|nr:hypothetical protein UFOVP410_126 [uncultured Caudovirales phage]
MHNTTTLKNLDLPIPQILHQKLLQCYLDGLLKQYITYPNRAILVLPIHHQSNTKLKIKIKQHLIKVWNIEDYKIDTIFDTIIIRL